MISGLRCEQKCRFGKAPWSDYWPMSGELRRTMLCFFSRSSCFWRSFRSSYVLIVFFFFLFSVFSVFGRVCCRIVIFMAVVVGYFLWYVYWFVVLRCRVCWWLEGELVWSTFHMFGFVEWRLFTQSSFVITCVWDRQLLRNPKPALVFQTQQTQHGQPPNPSAANLWPSLFSILEGLNPSRKTLSSTQVSDCHAAGDGWSFEDLFFSLGTVVRDIMFFLWGFPVFLFF